MYSNNSEGNLTLEFTSDDYLVYSGFEIEIGCDIISGYKDISQGNNINFYPNPNNGSFFLYSDKVKECIIYSFSGQEIQSINPTSNSELFHSNLENGVYLILVKLENGDSYWEKMIVNK